MSNPRLTANQLVGYNLRRAREERGWTRQQAVEALAPYLGEQWKLPVLGKAERSAHGVVIRHFHADEIAAFSMAFDLPVTWFFLAPEDAQGEIASAGPRSRDTRSVRTKGASIQEWTMRLLGMPDALRQRLSKSRALVPDKVIQMYEQLFGQVVGAAIALFVSDPRREFQEQADKLRSMAGYLDGVSAMTSEFLGMQPPGQGEPPSMRSSTSKESEEGQA